SGKVSVLTGFGFEHNGYVGVVIGHQHGSRIHARHVGDAFGNVLADGKIAVVVGDHAAAALLFGLRLVAGASAGVAVRLVGAVWSVHLIFVGCRAARE